MNGVLQKIISLFEQDSAKPETKIYTFPGVKDDKESSNSKKVINENEDENINDLNEKLEITNKNIELLSKQVMKNSYVKAIENKINEIEEEAKSQDVASTISMKIDDLKEKFIVGKENQNNLRNKVMSPKA